MEENYCWALGQFKAPFQVVALIAGHAEPRFHSLPMGTLRSRGMLTAVGTAGAREVPVFLWGHLGGCRAGGLWVHVILGTVDVTTLHPAEGGVPRTP